MYLHTVWYRPLSAEGDDLRHVNLWMRPSTPAEFKIAVETQIGAQIHSIEKIERTLVPEPPPGMSLTLQKFHTDYFVRLVSVDEDS